MFDLASQASQGFASSPAGVLTGVGVPVLAAMVAYIWKRGAARLGRMEEKMQKASESLVVLDRFGKMEDALAQASRALAVLVDSSKRDDETLSRHTGSITNLTTATAVLRDRVDRHEEWAKETSDRMEKGIRDAIRSSQGRGRLDRGEHGDG